jgi:hypothetical protein
MMGGDSAGRVRGEPWIGPVLLLSLILLRSVLLTSLAWSVLSLLASSTYGAVVTIAVAVASVVAVGT